MAPEIIRLINALRAAYTDARGAKLDNLDATVSSRAAASSWSAGLATTLGTNVDAKISDAANGNYNIATISATGSWTVPTGYKGWVLVTLCGAGGGGSAGGASDGGAGGGGGSCLLRVPAYIDKAVTSTIPVTVGVGGIAGTGTGGAGGSGGVSHFGQYGNPWRFTAQGGAGGVYNAADVGEYGTAQWTTLLHMAPVSHWKLPFLYAAWFDKTTGGKGANTGVAAGNGGDVWCAPSSGPLSLVQDEYRSMFWQVWPYHVPQITPSTTQNGGCGGDSLGMGKDWSANAQGIGGGGRGGDNGPANGTAGADGVIYVEYFS